MSAFEQAEYAEQHNESSEQTEVDLDLSCSDQESQRDSYIPKTEEIEMEDEQIEEKPSDELKPRKCQRYSMRNVTKLTPFETYIAVIKGYCATLILFIPHSFVNGGWAMTSFAFLFSVTISAICVLKLVDSALQTKIYSYSGLVEHVLGRKAKLLSEFMIALSQYSFSVTQFLFMVESLKTSLYALFGLEVSKLKLSISVLSVVIPLATVRDIGKLSPMFMIGTFVLLGTVIVVSAYCIGMLSKNGVAPGLEVWN